jgi:PAS domain S-box-containing protein
LRASEQHFRALGENIAQLAWIADASGSVFWYNQRWYDYTGTTPPQMQGWGWEQVHEPSQLQRVRAGWQHSLETGQPWEDTFPLRRKDGEYGWFLSRAVPLRDSEGRITRWLGTNTDITELRQTQEALNQAKADLEEHAVQLEETVIERTAELREANAELEAFCYSLSHDMRGPLRAIKGFTHFAMAESGAGMNETARDYLQRVTTAAERLDRLIRDVLAFSRLPRAQVALQPVELEKLLLEIIRERPELQPPVAEVSIEGPLPLVRGHEALLTQCLTNLLGNAVKFVPRGVVPRVRVHSAAAGEKVRLWVEDNGIGIDKGTQTKIFEVFERGHVAADYEGTGIGLAIVRKAAQRMGGGVGVESESGRGSRFWLELLPASELASPT